jgi:methyl coenzyme M reductase alpha subunit
LEHRDELANSIGKEASMSIDEIVHTCSNENVARAAVASIGISFASRIKSAADGAGVSVGTYAARAVRCFAEVASNGGKLEVQRAMSGSDQPILRGLEVILSRELDESGLLDGEDWVVSRRLPDGHAAARACCYP